MTRRVRRAAARKSQTASNGASSAAALCEAGRRHLRAEQYLDAQLCCQQALAADSNHADALHLMGLLSVHAAQYDLAVEWFARAIRREAKPQYLASLGVALQSQARFEEALRTFEKAIQLKPDDAELWQHLGNVLVDLNRPDQALLSFQHALKLNPRDWKAANNSAHLLVRSGRLNEALSHFELCDQLQPDCAATLQMRALALYGLNRFEEGLADIKRAHALDPAQPDICNNTAVLLRRLGQVEEALPWFNKALRLRPDYPAAFTNKAAALGDLHRFTEVFATYDELGVLHPDHAEAEWGRALLHLLTGNFEAGWAGREVRWKLPDLPIARFNFRQPMWLGKEPIDGKTILVHVDEGLGDTIQFARYVPMVAALGARVILVVADALCPLLSKLPGVTQCLPLSTATLPPFDMYCPIGSLPLALGTGLETIPTATGYLPSPAATQLQTWEDRLGPHDRLRVGLVWSGNPKHKNDHNRSLPLRALSSVLDLDARFVSLQKDPRPEDKATLLENSEIVDLTAHLTDFAETAALISCLDLVITVDTSIAHLAAALGRPTWILLPYTPDYRWLLDRDDNPWYLTARLFRQTETREYAGVLDRVRTELQTLPPARSV